MNFTTLPISFRPNRPFRILFTPFMVNCIYRLCEGKRQIFPINARGLRDEPGKVEPSTLCDKYSDELELLGISKRSPSVIIFSDRDPEYTEFLKSTIGEGIKSGIYSYTKQRISYCSCGKIEIPTFNLDSIGEDRLKLASRTQSGWICKFCNSELYESLDRTLVLDLDKAPKVHVIPMFQIPKYESVRSTTSRTVLISRSHRSHANDVQVEDLTIDPDHCWQYFLNYLQAKYGINDFAVVVGVNQIHFAAQLVSLVKLTNPNIKISIVVTPLINLGDLSAGINRETTTRQLIHILGSKIGIRIFLALLVQWSREISNICLSDIDLIKKCLDAKVVTNLKTEALQLQDFEFSFHRQNILRLLKFIRQRSIKDGVASRIIETITT